MRPLSAVELLQAWEDGAHQTPTRRALILLAAATPEMALDELAALPIGQRDARLMRLREWMFGARVVGVTPCPACGEQLELNFTLDDIRVPEAALPAHHTEKTLKKNGCMVRFRLPNSMDLLAIEGAPSKSRLLERCVLSAMRRGEPVDLAQLPTPVVKAVISRMAEADPQADVQLRLACHACLHSWNALFDIVMFFWNEIHAWAQRTLRDVHSLASAYGWRESDILGLSAWRRQIYLEMVGR